MDTGTVWRHIDIQRGELVDLLEDLDAADPDCALPSANFMLLLFRPDRVDQLRLSRPQHLHHVENRDDELVWNPKTKKYYRHGSCFNAMLSANMNSWESRSTMPQAKHSTKLQRCWAFRTQVAPRSRNSLLMGTRSAFNFRDL